MPRSGFDRFDRAARRVLEVAWVEAAGLGDSAVGTEYLMLTLARSDATTSRLLAEAGVSVADLRRDIVGHRAPRPRPDPRALLATLGIDLDEVRQRARQAFGSEAISRAAERARRGPRRRPLRTYISCSRPLPSRSAESPLGGPRLAAIPRVTHVMKRATRKARPGLASPLHLLCALIEGEEPACELLTARGVDLHVLAEETRRVLDEVARHREAG